MPSCDIFLTTTPPWDPFIPSPGLGSIATVLCENGFSVTVRELNTYLYYNAPDDLKHLWLFENSYQWNTPDTFNEVFHPFEEAVNQFVDAVLAEDPLAIGFSTAYTKELVTAEVIKRIKDRQPEIKIILGGPGVSCSGSRKFYDDYLAQLVDTYVIGEGEDSIVELMSALKAGESIATIPGVLIPRHSDMTSRPPIRPIDRIPFPTYNEFIFDGPVDIVSPVLSRSCIGNCVFCNVRAMWGAFRIRSPENILKEMQYLVGHRKITRFFIYDSAINCHLGVLSDVCDGIIEKQYPLDWRALAIPRGDMPDDLLLRMRLAGCRTLEVGIESGSDRVIALMGKRFKSADAARFIRQVHNAGIEVVIFLIVGFPGETEDDFSQTKRFLQENANHIDTISSINTFMVLDDTPIKWNADRYGVKFPEERGDIFWYDLGGNTYDARKYRVDVLTEAARDCGISFVKSNLVNH